MPNGPEAALAFLTVAASATCAPLNPAYRDAEFEFYLTDLKAEALVVGSGMESPARRIAQELGIPTIELIPTLDEPAGAFTLSIKSTDQPIHDGFAEADDVALILHTSGTTSRPKIVPLTHSNLCNSGVHIASTLALRPDDRCLNVMPLFHIHGLVGAVMSSLTAGGSVICAPGFDAKQFFQWMDALEPTWFTAVPTMHQAVLAQQLHNREIITRCPLRFIRSSSAAMPCRVLRELEEVFGTTVIESYGMTEASHQITSNPMPPSPRKPGSVGVASGPEVAIMDALGQLLSTGEVGEVVIRGQNVTTGYENNSAANEAAITGGWLRTGDQGRFDSDRYLYLTGRLKEMINRGGEKIAPAEVDEVLNQHPAVAQAVAFSVPHQTLGEDIAAAVVLRTNCSADEQHIIAFASAHLAPFKVPQQVLIVDEIPKGPSGKLHRIGLADGLAEQLARRRADNFVSPESEIERELSNIWKELLKVDRVGMRDSFYAVGGESLTLAFMIAKVEERFKVNLPLDAFLRSPTVETISRIVQQRCSEAGAGLAPSALPEKGAGSISDSLLIGLKNRILQYLALYAPGFRTTRIWLHRMRGVSIGENVSIGLSTLIESAYPSLVSIGNNVTVGTRVVIIGHLRDLTTGARAGRQRTVQIEEGAYVGPGVIILPNVTIGRGAVVAAGSVVSSSVSPKTLVRGNPAVPIARCGVSLGGGVAYEDFVRQLRPIEKG